MRAGLIVIGPAVAIAALVGDDLVQGAARRIVHRGRRRPHDRRLRRAERAVRRPARAARCRCSPPSPLSRYWPVAGARSGRHRGRTSPRAPSRLSLGGIVWLGVAASLSSLTTTTLMLVADPPLAGAPRARDRAARDGRRRRGDGGRVRAAGDRGGAPGRGRRGRSAAAVVGLGVFVVLLRTLLPQHADVAMRMVAPVLAGRDGARPRPRRVDGAHARRRSLSRSGSRP